MAFTITVKQVTPYAVDYLVQEDGTPSVDLSRDILADIVAGGYGPGSPLYNYLNNAPGTATLASQGTPLQKGEAESLFTVGPFFPSGWFPKQHCFAFIACKFVSSPGVTLGIIRNEDGSGVGNFRLVFLAIKNNAVEEGQWLIRVELLHSIGA
jgi:hypothetical protein